MVQLWREGVVDRRSDNPIYRQLAEHILRLIKEGRLQPGQKLPPSRELAARLGVNRNTVTSTFAQLVAAGHLRSRVGQGTFVADPRQAETASADPAPMKWSFSRSVESTRSRVRPPKERTTHPDLIDFASLVPDEKLFPVEPFRVVLDDVLEREGRTLLQYGPAAGHPALRAHIAERLRARGVEAQTDNVLIVNGSQQAIDLICRVLLDPGDRVAVESPTYTIVLPLLAQYHAKLEEVPMTSRGLDVDVLETVIARARPKLLFTMPTFQNPTGITMGLDARQRLVELAAREQLPLIEDDFDSELRYAGNDLPPVKALDSSGCVIHIGTFSKGLFPGLRLGWITAPRTVIDALTRAKLIADYHTSLLLQAAVLEFCRRGHYDEHSKRLVTIYREKAEALTDAMQRHLPPGVTWTHPRGGFAFWLTLPNEVSAETLLDEGLEQGVVFTPGSHFYVHGNDRRHLRLSISRVPLERIDEGIERIGSILERSLREIPRDGERPTGREQEPALHI